MAAPKLSHTIQTTLGMVNYRGEAVYRAYPDEWTGTYRDRLEDSRIRMVHGAVPIWSSEEAARALFSKCVLESRIPIFTTYHDDLDVKCLRYNILACRDGDIDVNFMKRTITSLRRLDLEQTAAVVLSAIMNDLTIARRDEIVCSLIGSVDPSLLVGSCMWMTPTYSIEPQGSKFSRFVGFIAKMISKQDISIGEPLHWASLLPTLLRIRRVRPASKTRCLLIPQWIFDDAGADAPPDFAIWDANGRTRPGHEPLSPPPSDAIILPLKAFRSLQKRLLNYHQFWKPAVDLRKATHDLESDIIYGAPAIKHKVLPSTNTLLVAQYFMAIQRRLQRKIVSDGRGRFLAKGQSQKFIQNTPHIPTAFEVALDTAVAAGPAGQEGRLQIATGAVLPQIDECCLLMERYVFVYGGGAEASSAQRRSALVSREGGKRGRSTRGPVDEYNLLCDILGGLRKRAKEEGKRRVPGSVRKFLARDIMNVKDSWEDDAFADGFVPGWEPWLEMRRREGLLLSEWEGLDEEFDELLEKFEEKGEWEEDEKMQGDLMDVDDVDGGVSMPIR